MKKKKEIVFTPEYASDRCLAFLTDAVRSDEEIYVSVPEAFKAILLCDGKITKRIETCEKKKLSEIIDTGSFGTAQVAYIYRKDSMRVAYGFGNIACDLVYDADFGLKEGYLVGANGSYGVSVYDYALLLETFVGYREITVMSVRERLNAVLRGIGTRLLPVYLNEKNASAENLGALTDGFSEVIRKQKAVFSECAGMGIRLIHLTVDGIVAGEK